MGSFPLRHKCPHMKNFHSVWPFDLIIWEKIQRKYFRIKFLNVKLWIILGFIVDNTWSHEKIERVWNLRNSLSEGENPGLDLKLCQTLDSDHYQTLTVSSYKAIKLTLLPSFIITAETAAQPRGAFLCRLLLILQTNIILSEQTGQKESRLVFDPFQTDKQVLFWTLRLFLNQCSQSKKMCVLGSSVNVAEWSNSVRFNWRNDDIKLRVILF